MNDYIIEDNPRVYRFPNKFGAIVEQQNFDVSLGEGLYELNKIKFDGIKYKIISTEVLTEENMIFSLEQIKNLS